MNGMKKFLFALFLFFTIPVFANDGTDNSVKKQLNIKFEQNTPNNLKKAASKFIEIKDLYCQNNNNALCSKSYQYSNILSQINTATFEPTTENFQLIANFYKELQEFSNEQNRIETANKNDLIAQIQTKKTLLKTNLNNLIDLLNKENSLLPNPLPQDKQLSKNLTKLSKDDLNKNDTNLKTRQTQLTNLKLHNAQKEITSDIQIPENIQNLSEQELKNILQTISEQETAINNQIQLTNNNITILETENASKEAEYKNLLQELTKAKQKQAELLNKKDLVPDNKGNDKNTNDKLFNELKNTITDENKNNIKQYNIVAESYSTNEDIEKIKQEIENVNNNTKLLENFLNNQKNELEKCEKELSSIITNIDELKPMTLEQCQKELKKAQDEKIEKECIAERLKECSDEIGNLKSLFKSSVQNGTPDGYKYLYESRTSYCADENNPVYGVEWVGNVAKKVDTLKWMLKPTKNVENNQCRYNNSLHTITILSLSDAKEKLKTCVRDLRLLQEIEKECSGLTPLPDISEIKGSSNVENYINIKESDFNQCQNSITLYKGVPNTATIGNNKAIKYCRNAIASEACNTYLAGAILKYKQKGYNYSLTIPDNKLSTCKSYIEESLCNKYRTENSITEKPTTQSGQESYAYTTQCLELDNAYAKIKENLNSISSSEITSLGQIIKNQYGNLSCGYGCSASSLLKRSDANDGKYQSSYDSQIKSFAEKYNALCKYNDKTSAIQKVGKEKNNNQSKYKDGSIDSEIENIEDIMFLRLKELNVLNKSQFNGTSLDFQKKSFAKFLFHIYIYHHNLNASGSICDQAKVISEH